MLVGLHLRQLEMQMIEVRLDLMTLFKHVIDAVENVNFFEEDSELLQKHFAHNIHITRLNAFHQISE